MPHDLRNHLAIMGGLTERLGELLAVGELVPERLDASMEALIGTMRQMERCTDHIRAPDAPEDTKRTMAEESSPSPTAPPALCLGPGAPAAHPAQPPDPHFDLLRDRTQKHRAGRARCFSAFLSELLNKLFKVQQE